MILPGIGAVVGYAVGTFQVLAIDWWRRRAAHTRHLRLLRAELVRLSGYHAKFDWTKNGPPEKEDTPRAPKPTELFLRTVGETDFVLTDEHVNDNTQVSLLVLVDGCELLQFYVSEIMEMAAKRPGSVGELRKHLSDTVPLLVDRYDERIDEVLFIIDDAIRDIDRRLEVARFWPQLKRQFKRFPKGKNPDPIQPNDARIEEWRRRRMQNNTAPPLRG